MPSDAGGRGDERGRRRGGRPRRLERPRDPRPRRGRPRVARGGPPLPQRAGPARTTALYWDALRLHHEILTGLRRAARVAPDLRSIGIDTWGVDVGMLDEAGALVGNPVHHRDPRNLPAVERVHARIPQAELYARTGLQFMSINTLYQLEAARVTPAFAIVRRVLPLPDLLGYWLTGVVVAERTHASTTGPARSADRGLGRGAASRGWASTPRCCRRSPTPGRSGDPCCRPCGRRPACPTGASSRSSGRTTRPRPSWASRPPRTTWPTSRRARGRSSASRRPRRSSPRRAGRRTSPTRAAWTGRSGSCAT